MVPLTLRLFVILVSRMVKATYDILGLTVKLKYAEQNIVQHDFHFKRKTSKIRLLQKGNRKTKIK